MSLISPMNPHAQTEYQHLGLVSSEELYVLVPPDVTSVIVHSRGYCLCVI